MPFSGSAGDGTAVALPLQAAELRLFSRGLLTGRCGRLAFLALALLLLGSLPLRSCQLGAGVCALLSGKLPQRRLPLADRKSTRLNSSHSQISYAVFCLTNTT